MKCEFGQKGKAIWGHSENKKTLTPRTQWQEKWRSHGDWWNYSPSEMPYRNLEWRIDKKTFNPVKKSKLSLRFPSYTKARETMPSLRQRIEVVHKHCPHNKWRKWGRRHQKKTRVMFLTSTYTMLTFKERQTAYTEELHLKQCAIKLLSEYETSSMSHLCSMCCCRMPMADPRWRSWTGRRWPMLTQRCSRYLAVQQSLVWHIPLLERKYLIYCMSSDMTKFNKSAALW